MSFARYLTRTRRTAQLTQRELDVKAQLRLGHVKELEEGSTEWPVQETLIKVAAALGVSTDSLLGRAPLETPTVHAVSDTLFIAEQEDMFAIRGDQISDEDKLKRQAIDTMAGRRRYWLDYVRTRVCELYKIRARKDGEDAFVTADDARMFLEEAPGVPPAEHMNRNFLGAVFSKGGWYSCGMAKSQTKGRHSNRIFKWRMEDGQ